MAESPFDGLTDEEVRELGNKYRTYRAPLSEVYSISVPKGYAIAGPPIDNMHLDPSGKWNPWISEPTETPSTEVACDHKWVDVGFCFSKIVCSECNMEKPSGD